MQIFTCIKLYAWVPTFMALSYKIQHHRGKTKNVKIKNKTYTTTQNITKGE